MIKIPIENYEKDIDAHFSKEKKSEILDLFTKSNNLRSKREFREIQSYLQEACLQGDIDLIKIYLSETIQTEDLTFKIDRTTKTASLFQVSSNISQIIIPRTVQHKSIEYLITSITGTNRDIKTVKFAEDSAVNAIYFRAFSRSKINEIQFPSSLKELKEGWCNDTSELKKIIISPSNGQFIFIDDKYLLGKTDPNSDEFDIFYFANREIKEISIPSNIKVISPYAFYGCKNLTKVEISPNSNLQTIGSNAFSYSSIEEIFIPPNVEIIYKFAFAECSNLKKVKIPPNSNLKIIGSNAFSGSSIEEFFIPPKVSKICEHAFDNCIYLEKIDIPQNSHLQTIESTAFYETKINEIDFPASLKELENGWCYGANELKKIIISPLNGQFIFKDDKYLLGKIDPNSDEFDIFYFANREIREISIPSNIKVISPYAFYGCKNLTKVEISPNSNLQTIGSNAFSGSSIEEIIIPPKVSKICEDAFYICHNLAKIDLSQNSNIQTIESHAFCYSKIDEIYFPASVKELKKGWCCGAKELAKIIISPSNGQFIFKEDKYLLGKTDPNGDQFDKLLFANRRIKEISIPLNIKVISSFAFDNCKNLTKVEISPNSNLQTIESNAFSYSTIKEIFIPPKVSKICEDAFYECNDLTKIEFSPNSNLQTIESNAFSFLNIEKIFIPPKVSKICEDAFHFCQNLAKIEFSQNSNLQTIESHAFSCSAVKEIIIPPKVSKICEYAFSDCYRLQIVEISDKSELESFPLSAFYGCENAIFMIPSNKMSLIK